MNSFEIQKLFENITVWKRREERAPHKPLLLLYVLGYYLNGGDRLIPYAQIDQNLSQLLDEFGRYGSKGVQYPFWYLQNDGIWEIPHRENLHTNKKGDVSRKELLNLNICGGVPTVIYDIFVHQPELMLSLVKKILHAHFPDSLHEDILSVINIQPELNTRKDIRLIRDPEFREKILIAYQYRCAICGFDIRLSGKSICLEAAHIKWHQAGGPSVESNGLALCVLHHKLFDRGAFTISPALKIHVSENTHGTAGFNEWLLNFNGQNIQYPQRKSYAPSQEFLAWHVKEVFRGKYRTVSANSDE
ncbi:MAG: HNH endonuclease [SAR324 cluster bacterium]|nr:HNH endonuclease [SAR324 cluster bacterium]